MLASLTLALTALTAGISFAQDRTASSKDISREVLLDRIRGGWTGMLIGGLEGLPHEFKYKEAPRDTLPEFTFLEKGARSDDDNDFEWPHLWFMDQEGVIKLPYPRIVEIWKANMNSGIWVANKQARELVDQGVVPPETGSVTRNPHTWYNLSGQFCVESYGLIAPGMPHTAADIGLHYARIAVSEEPLQATQFWTSLIALRAFHEGSLDDALQLALAAVDSKSAMAEVVADVRKSFQTHPDDWKAARRRLTRSGGSNVSGTTIRRPSTARRSAWLCFTVTTIFIGRSNTPWRSATTPTVTPQRRARSSVGGSASSALPPCRNSRCRIAT